MQISCGDGSVRRVLLLDVGMLESLAKPELISSYCVHLDFPRMTAATANDLQELRYQVYQNKSANIDINRAVSLRGTIWSDGPSHLLPIVHRILFDRFIGASIVGVIVTKTRYG